MSFFEMVMLICFGVSWPFSIYRTIKTKSVKGKSIYFLGLIFTGYIAGILHKIIFLFDAVIFIYIINALMVATEIVLYFIYSGKEKPAQQSDQE